MIAIESGIWTSFLSQSDLELPAYEHPPTDSECLFPSKFLGDDPCHDFSAESVDELIRALGSDLPVTPPPSETDVCTVDVAPVVIPTVAFQPSPPSTPEPQEDDSSQAVPRHKRPAHKRAEVKRRGKIKGNLDDLRELLPPIHNQRKSESLILTKAADHCRHLKSELGHKEEEKARLRAEIAALSSEIDKFQKELPVMGLKPDSSAPKSKSMSKLYEEYVQEKTKKDWKFWIFSFMMKPLFETYTTAVSTSTVQSFLSSVQQWADETLGLTNLRSVITRGVLQISKETSILTKPEALQQEALQSALSSKS